MESPHQSLHDLFDSILDGNWTPTQKEDVCRLMEANPEAQPEYIQQLRIHCQLRWHCKIIDREVLTKVRSLTGSKEFISGESGRGPAHLRYIRWLAAMLMLCGALSIWYWGLGRTGNIVAEVIEQRGVTWDVNSTALKEGSFVSRGMLSSTAGEYKLLFRSGAVVEIVGPANLDIKSRMLVNLSKGQATAIVPEAGKGFTIATPVVDIVDQGTQFGVSVSDDSATDVIVFEGNVDLQRMLGEETAPQRLVRGEGVQVDREGFVERIMQVARNSTGAWRPIGHSEFSGGVIKSVRDNISSSDDSTFFSYQVAYGGLKEDALAYADHPHQWNGLTAEGLPEFLRGADLVVTFNDYRYLQDFSMTIELVRPANLYVFADDRIPAPEWLRNQFDDTGIDIGLDEGRWNHIPEEYEQFNINTTDTGAGKSIDNVFSVWRRRCEDTTPIVLGNAGEWATEGYRGRAMYGIAATPLDEPIRPAQARDMGSFAFNLSRH